MNKDRIKSHLLAKKMAIDSFIQMANSLVDMTVCHFRDDGPFFSGILPMVRQNLFKGNKFTDTGRSYILYRHSPVLMTQGYFNIRMVV